MMKSIDWRWVEIGFCLFVVFHLLPSYLYVQSFTGTGHSTFAYALWTFAALAPIGFYIGFRSTGVTILEPGLSALFYAVALVLGTMQVRDEAITFLSLAASLSWLGAAFVVSVASAWVGEKVQARLQGHK